MSIAALTLEDVHLAHRVTFGPVEPENAIRRRSFFNWNGYGASSRLVSLDNFVRVWHDPIFYHWFGKEAPQVLAYVSLTLAPAVFFYLLAQKHIIAGLTSGAVKG